MEHEFFWIDGVRCDEFGVRLQAPIEFSQPVPKITTESVPGRNGDLHYFENAFENITGDAKCFSMSFAHVEKALNAVMKWTLMEPGYHRLETTEEPEIYRMACVVEGPGTEIRMKSVAPFNISFDCMPQKFFKSGEKGLTFTSSGGILFNDGFEAKPLITVYGSGTGKLKVGNTIVDLNNTFSGPIILDCDLQDAYYGYINKNSEIMATTFPAIPPGKSTVEWSGGVESVTIIPRWWTL